MDWSLNTFILTSSIIVIVIADWKMHITPPPPHRYGWCRDIGKNVSFNPFSLQKLSGIWYEFARKGNVLNAVHVTGNVTFIDCRVAYVTVTGQRTNDSKVMTVTGRVKSLDPDHQSKLNIDFPEEMMPLLGWTPLEHYVLAVDYDSYVIIYSDKLQATAGVCIEYIYIFTRKKYIGFEKDDIPLRKQIWANLEKFGHTSHEFWFMDQINPNKL